ncbi:MAG: FAD:protein FMN transferase [Burkholderiales bacterium]
MHTWYARYKLALTSILILLLSGCGGEPLYQQQSYVFGTLVEVTLYGEPEDRAKPAVAEVFAQFNELHHTLHAWQESEVTRVNDAFAGGSQPAGVSPLLRRIIIDATRFSSASGGAFNPAIGGLVGLWGFHAEESKPQLPDPKAVAALLKARPRMTDIVLDSNTVHSRNRAVRLDFGGYAKGHALDRAAALLHARGVKNALINIGGNIMALGAHGKRPWQVGIQHPRKPGTVATLPLFDGEAIATSGDYQRFFDLGGRRYCHVIDPATGQPVQGVQSATVIAAPGPYAGALSDAATKPLFIAGKTGWLEAAQRMGIAKAMLIDDQGEIYITPELQQRLKFPQHESRGDTPEEAFDATGK